MTTWEDFETDVATEAIPNRPLCTVQRVLNGLDDDARSVVEAVLDNPSLSHSAIQRAFEKRMGKAAPRRHTIARHRRGECSC